MNANIKKTLGVLTIFAGAFLVYKYFTNNTMNGYSLLLIGICGMIIGGFSLLSKK